MRSFLAIFEDLTRKQSVELQLRCLNEDEVKKEAVRELLAVASSRLPDGDQHLFAVTVRDETDVTVFRASLNFTVET